MQPLQTLNANYVECISDNFKIINKENKQVPFILNPIQTRFLTQDYNHKSIILKARQQGFSSLINAIFTVDFLFKPHTYNLVVADDQDNAEGLLKRVKDLIASFEEKNNLKIPLKYNTKYSLYWELMDSTYVIGTAENTNLGRSKTVTNLHLSEVAFYRNMEEILAGAVQAVIPEGRTFMETTANGFDQFKEYWDRSKRGETVFKPLFYRASDFYSREFLDSKRLELGEKFKQEYPETDIEAFLTTGNKYFDSSSLELYLEEVSKYSRETSVRSTEIQSIAALNHDYVSPPSA